VRTDAGGAGPIRAAPESRMVRPGSTGQIRELTGQIRGLLDRPNSQSQPDTFAHEHLDLNDSASCIPRTDWAEPRGASRRLARESLLAESGVRRAPEKLVGPCAVGRDGRCGRWRWIGPESAGGLRWQRTRAGARPETWPGEAGGRSTSTRQSQLSREDRPPSLWQPIWDDIAGREAVEGYGPERR